jgi:transposase-like protein
VRLLTACRKPATGSSPSRGYRRVSRKAHRTTNAIERLHEEFKRRIKAQTGLPSTETAAMLFWALLASNTKSTCAKVDGWNARHKAHRSAN